MLRRLALPLLGFFGLTALLLWFWLRGGLGIYVGLLLALLTLLHEALGLTFTGKGSDGLSLRFMSHVPFLVLMIVTPGLSRRQRLLGWLVGAAIVTALHLFLLTLANAAFVSGEQILKILLPFLVLADGLPLLVWVIVARGFLRTLVPGFQEQPPEARGASAHRGLR